MAAAPLMPRSLPGSWLKVIDHIADKSLPVLQPGAKVGSSPLWGAAGRRGKAE